MVGWVVRGGGWGGGLAVLAGEWWPGCPGWWVVAWLSLLLGWLSWLLGWLSWLWSWLWSWLVSGPEGFQTLLWVSGHGWFGTRTVVTGTPYPHDVAPPDPLPGYPPPTTRTHHDARQSRYAA